MKIKFSISMGRNAREEIVEFEEGATDEEIDQGLIDWMNNYVDCGWSKV